MAGTIGLRGGGAPWTGLDVGSPFDYPQQGIAYVAAHLPPPGATVRARRVSTRWRPSSGPPGAGRWAVLVDAGRAGSGRGNTVALR